MSRITEEQRAEIADVVQIVVDAALPAVLKCIAASQPGVTMCGELLTTEPIRDYRKEAWLLGFGVVHPVVSRESFAEETLAAFDRSFPT